MSIVDDVDRIISKESCYNSEKIKSFIKSAEWFNEMEKRGLVKPRGNQIMPLDEVYRRQARFDLMNCRNVGYKVS